MDDDDDNDEAMNERTFGRKSYSLDIWEEDVKNGKTGVESSVEQKGRFWDELAVADPRARRCETRRIDGWLAGWSYDGLPVESVNGARAEGREGRSRWSQRDEERNRIRRSKGTKEQIENNLGAV